MKKRFLSAVLVVTILLTLAASVNAAVTPRIAPEYTYRTVFNSANIRADSNASAGVVTTVGLHKILYDYLNRSTADYWLYSTTKWTRVTYNTYNGYIRNDLMAPTSSLYITTADVNLRSDGELSAGYIVTIETGTQVARTGFSKVNDGYTWYAVVIMDGNNRAKTGWMVSNYLRHIS